jgi:general secretion pathway protein K
VREREKGIALIMTLWVLVLLTIVAMSFSFSSRRGSASTRNLKEDTQGYYFALSTYEEVLSYLLTDPDPTVDYLDEDGNFRTDEERPPFAMPAMEGANVDVRLSDEESRININELTRKCSPQHCGLLELFENIGVPADERQPLADSLMDWIDPDDEHHLSGAEDEYYKGFGYSTKDRPLDMPEELLLIKGFTKEHLYGGKDLGALESIITTHGSGINVNTVPVEVLQMLGFKEESIANLLIHRAKPGGTKMVPPEMAALGRTTSSNFRIQVVARMSNNPLAVRITSVVRREFGPKGAVLTTLYWKEDIESSRT